VIGGSVDSQTTTSVDVVQFQIPDLLFYRRNGRQRVSRTDVKPVLENGLRDSMVGKSVHLSRVRHDPDFIFHRTVLILVAKIINIGCRSRTFRHGWQEMVPTVGHFAVQVTLTRTRSFPAIPAG